VLPVLPTTLQASESDGGPAAVTLFQRVIVMPDGHKYIEGVTPKQLPAPEKIDVTEPPQLLEEQFTNSIIVFAVISLTN
jgi:hypothetical protein